MSEILIPLQTVTANDILSESLENIGAKRPDVALSAIETTNLLRTLNFMLDSMSVDGLLLYAYTDEDFPLIADQEDYTIGDDENYDFDTIRPESIVTRSCYIRDSSNVDYPLLPLTEEEYNQINYKTGSVSGILATVPTHLFYKLDVPRGTIKLYPPPTSGLTLHLVSRKAFTSFPDASTELSFPAGYPEMLSANFSVRIAPKYGKSIPNEIAVIAERTLSALQTKNTAARPMRKDIRIPKFGR